MIVFCVLNAPLIVKIVRVMQFALYVIQTPTDNSKIKAVYANKIILMMESTTFAKNAISLVLNVPQPLNIPVKVVMGIDY